MPLRDFAEVPYLPMLSIRPAEMRALEELPNQSKDRLLPVTHLRQWVGSHDLEKTTNRLAEAYGDRPIIVGIGDPEVVATPREVHAELQRLRDPRRGFSNWCSHLEGYENYIPLVQFGPPDEEVSQIRRLYGLGRGLVVQIERAAFGATELIASRVGELTNGGEDVLFILDFGVASRDHLQVAARAVGYIARIRANAPLSVVSLSASSFPDSFSGVERQQIYERLLFDEVRRAREAGQIVYSDRGSARAERQIGGGGAPYPRVDYPLATSWEFYRSDEVNGFQGYFEQSRALMASGIWNANLRVWGTQMIERTAAGDTSAITSPQKATASRINIHLQRQAYYDLPNEVDDTDEDWDG